MTQQCDLFGAAPRPARPPRVLDEAVARKRNGQFRAQKKAGSWWVNESLKRLRRWLKEREQEQEGHYGATGQGRGVEFTFEEFRVRSEIEGWPLPASVNAWGSLPTVAEKAGICHYTGRVDTAKRPESHGRLLKVWRSA